MDFFCHNLTGVSSICYRDIQPFHPVLMTETETALQGPVLNLRHSKCLIIIKLFLFFRFRQWWIHIKIMQTTFSLHIHRRNINAVYATKNFQLHQNFHAIWESTVEKNLTHALTVGNDLLRKITWTNICVLTPANAPTRAPIASTPVHTNSLSQLTYAHTQGRNHSPVMCVGSYSLQEVIWSNTRWLTQGRKLANMSILLWEVVCFEEQLDHISSHTHRRQTVWMWWLWEEVNRLEWNIQRNVWVPQLRSHKTFWTWVHPAPGGGGRY